MGSPIISRLGATGVVVPAATIDPLIVDDPNNTWGFGAAAVIRGTLNVSTCSGLTMGSGVSTAVRQANHTVLQNAINRANTSGLILEWNDGTYEIDGTGLQTPQTSNGLIWRGSRGAVIKQFRQNARGLMIGDWNNALGGYSNNMDVNGLRIAYGTSQANIVVNGNTTSGSTSVTVTSATGIVSGQSISGTGIPGGATITAVSGTTLTISAAATATGTTISLTIRNIGANLLTIGALTRCRVCNVDVGADFGGYTNPLDPSTAPAYRAVYFQSGGAGAQFSNEFSNWHVAGATWRLCDMQNLGTGSRFSNWYVHNGYYQAPGVIEDVAFSSGPGAQEGIFEQFNFEAIQAPTVINLQTMRESQWISLHFESIVLTGFNPEVIQAGTCRLSIRGAVFSGQCNTTNASGFGSFIATFSDDTIDIDKVAITAAVAGDYNLTMRLINVNGATDSKPVITVRGIVMDDFIGGGLSTRFELDNNLLLANYPGITSVDSYSWGQKISKVTHAEMAASASFTFYGQMDNSVIHVPASLGSNITITLSQFRKTGTTIPVPDGTIVNIRRDSGTAANNLLVVDGNTAATLTTNTTAATELFYQFKGSTGSWISY